MTKIILILICTLILSACSLNVNINQDQTPTPTNPIQTPTDTVQPSQPSQAEPIEDQLITFFSNKFNKPSSEAKLTVSQNTGTHATGGISFQAEMGGGMWLAHNDNGIWIVDYDGNGTISCTSVENKNYPSSILTECWDETNQVLKYL